MKQEGWDNISLTGVLGVILFSNSSDEEDNRISFQVLLLMFRWKIHRQTQLLQSIPRLSGLTSGQFFPTQRRLCGMWNDIIATTILNKKHHLPQWSVKVLPKNLDVLPPLIC